MDTANPSKENSITPGRRPPLLARIVIVRSDIVLVRRSEGNWTLGECPEPEAWVTLPGQQELITFQDFGQIIRLHCGDDGISGHRVYSIVEISVEYTYLMIEDQGAIASADKHVSPKRWGPLCRQ